MSEQTMEPPCQCPICGRMHKPLGFGKPPPAIAGPDFRALLIEAERALTDCLEMRSHLNYAIRDKIREAIAKSA